MAIIRVHCGCEDAPCCGCDEVAYTGADAVEVIREHDDAQDILDRDDDDGFDDSMDGDYGPCSMAAYDDQFEV